MLRSCPVARTSPASQTKVVGIDPRTLVYVRTSSKVSFWLLAPPTYDKLRSEAQCEIPINLHSPLLTSLFRL